LDHQPRPRVRAKKRARDRLIRLAGRHPDWALGFQDEVWWSRLARPRLRCWRGDDRPLRLVEQAVAKGDPDPKALACYGLYLRPPAGAPGRMWLRFVDGRPLSAVTVAYLRWCCEKLAAEGKKALLLVWDNASWHVSREVRAWLRAHNRAVRRTGAGVRILACFLPTKSPWLNAIEPKWAHGKRKVHEPDRLLTAGELIERVCAYYGCPHEPHLATPDQAANNAPAKKVA
jgi:transposase